MHIFRNSWYENAVSVERGPLTYALKIGQTSKVIKNDKDPIDYGDTYEEIYPTTPWNYGLIEMPENKLTENYHVEKRPVALYPWNPENAPLAIKAKAVRIPSWGLYNESAGPIPFSYIFQMEVAKEEEEIVLIPYGCSNLRVSQFPVIRR
jgi:hypothetical protein